MVRLSRVGALLTPPKDVSMIILPLCRFKAHEIKMAWSICSWYAAAAGMPDRLHARTSRITQSACTFTDHVKEGGEISTTVLARRAGASAFTKCLRAEEASSEPCASNDCHRPM